MGLASNEAIKKALEKEHRLNQSHMRQYLSRNYFHRRSGSKLAHSLAKIKSPYLGSSKNECDRPWWKQKSYPKAKSEPHSLLN